MRIEINAKYKYNRKKKKNKIKKHGSREILVTYNFIPSPILLSNEMRGIFSEVTHLKFSQGMRLWIEFKHLKMSHPHTLQLTFLVNYRSIQDYQ